MKTVFGDIEKYVENPLGVISLTLNRNTISYFPDLNIFANIQELRFDNIELSSLPNLPDSIRILHCAEIKLRYLPKYLPYNLQQLICYENNLTSLPALPPSLQVLNCSSNQLTSLPSLPITLQKLHCSSNQLESIPNLPYNLKEFFCYNNQLSALPLLPAGLATLGCAENQLTVLPPLPDNLRTLHCYNNQLIFLPPLPDNLRTLYCYGNQLYCLPDLPENLILFFCFNNDINLIIEDYDVDVMRYNIKIANIFRELYYSLKFKTQFVKWLWRTREYNIQLKYHPDYLVKKLIEEDGDIDDVLENW